MSSFAADVGGDGGGAGRSLPAAAGQREAGPEGPHEAAEPVPAARAASPHRAAALAADEQRNPGGKAPSGALAVAGGALRRQHGGIFLRSRRRQRGAGSVTHLAWKKTRRDSLANTPSYLVHACLGIRISISVHD